MIFPTIFLRPDIFIFIVTTILLAGLIVSDNKQWLPHLGLAMGISLVWNVIAVNEYGYNQAFYSIGPISIFPLFAWTIGLFLIHIIYTAVSTRLSFEGFLKQLLLYIALYWPILLTAETIGYYTFNIRNEAAAQYAGLPFCDCLHAPTWMQASYLLIGPIYFFLIYFASKRTPELAQPHRS